MTTNQSNISHYYPKLYHMAESGSWPSIKKHGLLSTSALLDLFEVKGKKRHEIERHCRPDCVKINHNDYGTVVIRDQKPLREKTLHNLLDGMSTEEYYSLLNHKTFFWVRRERLERLLNARAYRNRSHTVLTLDTGALVEDYNKKIWLAHINSGSAIFGTGRRGIYTFKQIADYPFEELKKRKKEDAIVELAVDYGLPNIVDYVIRVEEWIGNKAEHLIWKP